jgi:diacylglycerol kinase family enzyme
LSAVLSEPKQPLAAAEARAESIPIAGDAPLFIVMNRGSGHHEGEDVRLVIEATLTSAGRVFTLEEVAEPEKLGEAAARAVERAIRERGIVVAAGGDGTINTIAEATLGSGCPFGVLPLGTFNYFGRAHGIPSDPQTACQILLAKRAYAVQVGLVNDRVFLVNGSIGLYPELLEEREQAKQKLGRSRWVAFGAALATLLRPHRLLSIDVESQGQRTRLVTPTLFIGNNRLQLERVGIAAASLLERHRLVAVALRPVGALAMLGLVVRALFGRLGDDQRVISFPFQRMTVRSRFGRGRFKVATDGEVEWLRGPLTFRVAPHALLLLCPEDPGDDPG